MTASGPVKLERGTGRPPVSLAGRPPQRTFLTAEMICVGAAPVRGPGKVKSPAVCMVMNMQKRFRCVAKPTAVRRVYCIAGSILLSTRTLRNRVAPAGSHG